jgi:undecaprenyl-diphosphatase
MTWWEAIVLGVVQGLTEFFPVSSSGHLVLTQRLLGLAMPGIFFDVALHVATLLSVLIVYRDTIIRLFNGLTRRGEEGSWPYVLKLGLATLPAAAVGLTLEDFVSARFDDPVFAGSMILVTGCVVWSSRWARGIARFGLVEFLPITVAAVFSLLAGTILPFVLVLGLEALVMTVAWYSGRSHGETQQPTWGGAAIMGFAQAIAILPGISRSGSTVIAGLWRRLDPVAAAEFSFLMSVPAILGAAVLQLPEAMETGIAVPVLPLALGFIAAGVSGVFAIRFFVALLKRQNFYIFAWYCWAAAGLFLLFERIG